MARSPDAPIASGSGLRPQGEEEEEIEIDGDDDDEYEGRQEESEGGEREEEEGDSEVSCPTIHASQLIEFRPRHNQKSFVARKSSCIIIIFVSKNIIF
jgi:hypothetical protein